jgi:hypothetical protein
MTTPAPSIDDVIYAIRAYAHYRGWAPYELAKQARLGPTTLRDFRKDKWAPNVITLRILRDLIPDDFDPDTIPGVPVPEADDAPSRRHDGSGVEGVDWHNLRHKWRATIERRGHKEVIGYFADFEAAAAARRKAERKAPGSGS